MIFDIIKTLIVDVSFDYKVNGVLNLKTSELLQVLSATQLNFCHSETFKHFYILEVQFKVCRNWFLLFLKMKKGVKKNDSVTSLEMAQIKVAMTFD